MLLKTTLSIFMLCLYSTTYTYAQESLQLISSFAKFLEEKSDKSNFPSEYTFQTAYKIAQHNSKTDSTTEFYILTNKNKKYFGMTSQLNVKEVMVFDINLDLLIVFCQIDTTKYAISGPLSFFNTTKKDNFNFTKKEENKYYSKTNNEEITLTISQDLKYSDYGLKKGFWMINQESSSVNTPLSKKGVILIIEKLDKASNLKTTSSVVEKLEYQKIYSIEESKILDFGILTDSTFYKH